MKNAQDRATHSALYQSSHVLYMYNVDYYYYLQFEIGFSLLYSSFTKLWGFKRYSNITEQTALCG